MSTTTNLGLFKHDNPSTNKDIFDVDKALNQNLDKIDTAVGKDRERLDLLEASNTIYDFKGKADTLDTIKSKAATQGDVWYCEADSTYYAYNGTDWIPVSLNLKLGVIDELQAKTIKCLQEVETPTPVSGTSIDINDSAEAKITELKISGNRKQETREGYNILPYPYSETTKTYNGVTVTDNGDGTLTLNGTSTGTINFYLRKYTDVWQLNTGIYTFSNNCNSAGVTMIISGNVENIAYTYGTNKIKFEVLQGGDVGCNFIIQIASGYTFSNTKLQLMILEEDYTTNQTIPTFESYGASPSPDYPSEVKSCGDNGCITEVICNKNWIDKSKFARKGLSSGSVGAEISKISSTTRLLLDEEIISKPNATYSFSLGTSKSLRYNIFEIDENNIILKVHAITSNADTTFTTSENTRKINIMILWQTTTNEITLDAIANCNIQLEEGTKTDYEEHKEQVYTIPTQQPFRAIGDIRDTFVKKNNKRYEQHNITRLILDGTEDWNYVVAANGLNRFDLLISDIAYNTNNILSSHFKYKFSNEYNCIFCLNSNRLFIVIDIETVEEFKAWLQAQYEAGTPVYVDYVLSEPIDIECTEEQSEILFDIEQNAKTYKNITHMYSTDNVSSNKTVTYKKDIETLFANTLAESGV